MITLIEQQRETGAGLSLAAMCRVLEIPRSAYYRVFHPLGVGPHGVLIGLTETPKNQGHNPIISTNPSCRTLPDRFRSS